MCIHIFPVHMFQHYGMLNPENYLNHGMLGYTITVLRQVYMDNSPTHKETDLVLDQQE